MATRTGAATLGGLFVSPTGFAQAPDSVSYCGAITDHTLSANSLGQLQLPRLDANGFRYGYCREWFAASSTTSLHGSLVILIYRFSAISGAEAYSQQIRTPSMTANGTPDELQLPLAAVPDAWAFTSVDGQRTRSGFVKDVYFVTLDLTVPDAGVVATPGALARAESTLNALTREQWQHIP